MSDTTPREIELKLEVEPDDLDRVRAHPMLQQGGDATATQVLHSTYFDTPDRVLRKAGLSLRIRRVDGRRIQTVKAARDATGLALDRDEWEHEVEGDTPDLSLAQGAPLDAVRNCPAAIQPLFSLTVERTSLTLDRHGSQVEVALDRGRIDGRDGGCPFAEVEIELKSGDPNGLFDLALALSEAAPLRLSFKAKSDRGFEILDGEEPTRVKAEPIVLARRMTCSEAFQIIARSCLRHLVANESILRQRENPEAVHQMRVALRRLRAAVTLFKDVVADERREPIRAELKWMANALGQARDIDVFIADTLEPARERHGSTPEFKALVKEYEAKRAKTYKDVRALVVSFRFLRAILETAAWIETGGWLSREDKAARALKRRRVVDHARNELAQRWRKIRKRGKRLSELDPESRHRVRIDIKKLRYASEFFDSLFKGSGMKKRKRAALAALEGLQETLGGLNDIAVGADAGPSPAAEMLRLDQLARVDDLLAAARTHYRDFSKLEPFWEAAGKGQS
jgi:inorganic triphosphatase YgiF